MLKLALNKKLTRVILPHLVSYRPSFGDLEVDCVACCWGHPIKGAPAEPKDVDADVRMEKKSVYIRIASCQPLAMFGVGGGIKKNNANHSRTCARCCRCNSRVVMCDRICYRPFGASDAQIFDFRKPTCATRYGGVGVDRGKKNCKLVMNFF
jgi:hypothetical protein